MFGNMFPLERPIQQAAENLWGHPTFLLCARHHQWREKLSRMMLPPPCFTADAGLSSFTSTPPSIFLVILQKTFDLFMWACDRGGGAYYSVLMSNWLMTASNLMIYKENITCFEIAPRVFFPILVWVRTVKGSNMAHRMQTHKSRCLHADYLVSAS